MVQTSCTYACERCGRSYSDPLLAEACESLPPVETTFNVGDFVGSGIHGWWKGDKTWTAVTPQRDGERHAPAFARRGEWAHSSAAPDGFVNPGKWWFLPIWRVAAVVEVAGFGMPSHRAAFLLWTPRHANRGVGGTKPGGVGTATAKTYTIGHFCPLALPDHLIPALTPPEKHEWQHLVAKVAADPRAAIDATPLL